MVTIEIIENSIYICDVCGIRYGTKDEAEECEARGTPESKFKVGDEVRIIDTDSTEKKIRGKTGIVNVICFFCPNWYNKTEPHGIMYIVILDGEEDESLLSEGILELK